MVKLNRNEPFAEHIGSETPARYSQNGLDFDSNGNELDTDGNLLSTASATGQIRLRDGRKSG